MCALSWLRNMDLLSEQVQMDQLKLTDNQKIAFYLTWSWEKFKMVVGRLLFLDASAGTEKYLSLLRHFKYWTWNIYVNNEHIHDDDKCRNSSPKMFYWRLKWEGVVNWIRINWRINWRVEYLDTNELSALTTKVVRPPLRGGPQRVLLYFILFQKL